MNDLQKVQASARWYSYASILLAVVGAALYWWVPTGIVLSLAGLTIGFVDWTVARWRSRDYRLALAGMLLSVLALTLDIVIASMGLQTWTMGGNR